jgi:hypothetical protein
MKKRRKSNRSPFQKIQGNIKTRRTIENERRTNTNRDFKHFVIEGKQFKKWNNRWQTVKFGA